MEREGRGRRGGEIEMGCRRSRGTDKERKIVVSYFHILLDTLVFTID